jgi:hypothetical protein
MNRINPKKVAIALSAFVCAAALSIGWSEQGGISLSVAQARAEHPYYAGVVRPYHHHYYDVTTAGGLPWYAVRAYYAGGPWRVYSGWDDYAARNGAICRPGSLIKGGDGIIYVCQ